MKIIILKRTLVPTSSHRYWKPGQNVDVTMDLGDELVRKKNAGEIPQLIGDEWYMGGRVSSKLPELRKLSDQGPVTLEEWEKNTKFYKEKK